MSCRLIESVDLKIRNTTAIFKPANAMNTFSGLELLGIPVDKNRLDPNDYIYPLPFEYYRNQGSGEKLAPSYFILEVLFVIEDDIVIFHPKEIVLSIDGNELRPASYFRLERRYDSIYWLSHIMPLCMAPGSYSASPENPLKFATSTDVTAPIRLEKSKSYCFAVKFERPPPDPRDSFSIEINDLIVDGKPFSFRINYKPGEHKGRYA